MAERETQVRSFVEEVWNGRNYEAAADRYSDNYVNPFGAHPPESSPSADTTLRSPICASMSKS